MLTPASVHPKIETSKTCQGTAFENATDGMKVFIVLIVLVAQSVAQAHPARATETKVHVASVPTGAELYVDGNFRGNTPSDIFLSSGEHVVRVVLHQHEWTRTVKITGGEINIDADLGGENDTPATNTQRMKTGGPPFGASQSAVDTLRDLARKMRDCRTRSVVFEHKWGKKATDTERIWSGPPSNVTWDVQRGESARSPCSGYLQFAQPADIDVPAASYSEWSKKEGLIEEEHRKMFSLEFRYEFDVGPSGLEVVRLLTRNEGDTNWETATGNLALPTCATTPSKGQQPATDSQAAPK